MAQARRTRPGRVLYVDDEEGLVRLARRLLEQAGYDVAGFTSAEQALLEFRRRPADFALVVSDVSMSGMSGFELSAEVLKVRADIPVVLTSGCVTEEDARRARCAGVVRIIEKPGTMQELVRAIDAIFRQSLPAELSALSGSSAV